MIQQILTPLYTIISEWTFWFVIIVLMVMGLLASLQLQDKSARFIIKNTRKQMKAAGGWIAQKGAERYGQKAQEVGTKISTSKPARIPVLGGLVRTAGDKVAAFRAYGEKEWEKEKKQALSTSTSHNLKTAMISDDPDEFKGKIMAELEKQPEDVWNWLNRNDIDGTSDEKKEKFRKMISYMSKTGRHREFLWYFPEFAGAADIKPDLNDRYDRRVMGITDPTDPDYADSQAVQAEYVARFGTDADAIKDAKLTRIYAGHIKKEREKHIVAIASQDVLQGLEDNPDITVGETINSRTRLKSYEETLIEKYQPGARATHTPITDATKENVARDYVKVLRPQSMKNIPEGKLKQDPFFLNALANTKNKLDFKSLETIKEIQGDEDFESLLETVAINNPDEFIRLGKSLRTYQELMSKEMQERYDDYKKASGLPPPGQGPSSPWLGPAQGPSSPWPRSPQGPSSPWPGSPQGPYSRWPRPTPGPGPTTPNTPPNQPPNPPPQPPPQPQPPQPRPQPNPSPTGAGGGAVQPTPAGSAPATPPPSINEEASRRRTDIDMRESKTRTDLDDARRLKRQADENKFLDIINPTPPQQNPPQLITTLATGTTVASPPGAERRTTPQELDLGGGVKILDMFENAGRRVFVVRMPDGTVRPFYRSTGTAMPGQKLKGDINPFGGWMEKNLGYFPAGWFIKGTDDELKLIEEGPQKRLRPADPSLRAVADLLKQHEDQWQGQQTEQVLSPKEANERLRKYNAIIKEKIIRL